MVRYLAISFLSASVMFVAFSAHADFSDMGGCRVVHRPLNHAEVKELNDEAERLSQAEEASDSESSDR